MIALLVAAGSIREALPVTDNKDQVSLDALLRSQPVPNTFAATFAWGRDWWANQENGLCEDMDPAPEWDDVERTLWKQFLTGQEP